MSHNCTLHQDSNIYQSELIFDSTRADDEQLYIPQAPRERAKSKVRQNFLHSHSQKTTTTSFATLSPSNGIFNKYITLLWLSLHVQNLLFSISQTQIVYL